MNEYLRINYFLSYEWQCNLSWFLCGVHLALSRRGDASYKPGQQGRGSWSMLTFWARASSPDLEESLAEGREVVWKILHLLSLPQELSLMTIDNDQDHVFSLKIISSCLFWQQDISLGLTQQGISYVLIRGINIQHRGRQEIERNKF